MVTVWLKQVFPRSQTRMVVKLHLRNQNPDPHLRNPRNQGHLAKHKKSETGESPHKYWTYAEEASDQDDANQKEPALGKGKRIKGKRIRKPKIRDGDWFYC